MNNTRAITALREIMLDTSAPLNRRIEAAEQVLGYEAPESVVTETKAFLITVFESGEVGIDEKLQALRLTRKAEAPRVAAQTVKASDANTVRDREIWRHLEMAARRERLHASGIEELLPRNWADDLLTDDYQPPSGMKFSDFPKI